MTVYVVSRDDYTADCLDHPTINICTESVVVKEYLAMAATATGGDYRD